LTVTGPAVPFCPATTAPVLRPDTALAPLSGTVTNAALSVAVAPSWFVSSTNTSLGEASTSL
jgi:hypothetical protein